MKQTCMSCIHAVPSHESGDGFVCAAEPPLPLPLQAKHPMTGEVTMVVSAMRPPVNDDTPTCRHFEEINNDG